MAVMMVALVMMCIIFFIVSYKLKETGSRIGAVSLVLFLML